MTEQRYTAVTHLAPSDYEIDEGSGGPVFTIRPLNGLEMAEVTDYIKFDENRNTIFPAKACEIILKHGLIGWKNFKDREGNDVEFDKFDQLLNLTRLPFVSVRRIADRIIDISDLGVEDAKKS